MEQTILTLTVLLSLVLCTQVIALYMQYKVNKTYKGIGYWLLGSSLMALGIILTTSLVIENCCRVSSIANPLIVLGNIFLYIGIQWFVSDRLKKWIPFSIFISFIIFYIYYVYINENISASLITTSIALAIIAFVITYKLYFKKEEYLSSTANFTASVFLTCGVLNIVHVVYIISNPSENPYIDQDYIMVAILIIDIIISNLWTLGLIIMVNQRLNIDNQLKNEKLQIIFNTSLDAQLVTRINDGFIIDVNDEFTHLSGYEKDEVIGSYTKRNILWLNDEDRNYFVDRVKKQGICKNKDFIFKRKNASKFNGLISARTISIHSKLHIISVVRDITFQKETETRMQKLIEELEKERNIAQLNAITDSLSGLYNRGYSDKILRTEFYRLTRSGSYLSLIMVDIDFFKKYNDNYGHLAGDKCIQMIAEVLKNTVDRAADVVARYGGEEFIIILPETGEKGAKTIGAEIIRGIENLAIPHRASEVSDYVTVSAGISTVYPYKLTEPEQAIKLADDALYLAKEEGRNRFVYKF